MRTLLAESRPPQYADEKVVSRPRSGLFVAGWTNKSRLKTIANGDIAEIAALAEASNERSGEGVRTFSRTAVLISFNDLMEVGVDGVGIAMPGEVRAESAAPRPSVPEVRRRVAHANS